MAYTRLRYHIVTATKHREPLLTLDVEEVAYPVLIEVAERLGGKITHVGGVEDHIHMIAAIPPVLAVSDFVKGIKVESTKAIKRECPHRRGFAWQASFGAFTVDPANMKGIIQYVLNQKEHHRTNELWTRCERMG